MADVSAAPRGLGAPAGRGLSAPSGGTVVRGAGRRGSGPDRAVSAAGCGGAREGARAAAGGSFLAAPLGGGR